jgi:hypothetical protein
MDKVETFLAHYGVKGMRWGYRRSDAALARAAAKRAPTPVTTTQKPGKRVKATGGANQKATDDAIAAAMARQKAKASSTDALSNRELQAVVQRMNLEQQYARLSSTPQTAGQKFVKRMFTDKQHRERTIDNVQSLPAVKQLRDVMDVGNTVTKTDLTKIY